VPKLIALDLPGGEYFVSSLLRIWDEGNAVLPLDQRLPLKERHELVSLMGASTVISSDGEHTGMGRPVEDGDALVVVTSGTGGATKGAVLTHDALSASAQMTSEALSVDPSSDRWLSCLPVSHIGGLSVITRSLLSGTELVVHSEFSAHACERSGLQGSTLVSLVVTAMRRIDTSLFRKVLVGGSNIPDDLPENVVATYGMTETGSGVVYDGFPLKGVELKIQNGEILLKSPSMFRCYRDRGSPFQADGWFLTGDGGELVSDGKLKVFGRLEEVIVSGGEKIWPISVETALSDLSWINEAAVVGQPDAEWGELVTAFVVLKNKDETVSLRRVREELDSILPRYALPRVIQLVDRLPKTTSGKVLKSDLRSNLGVQRPRFSE